MYSRHEASQLRQQFWTAFGQYMAPLLSAEGEKTNWVNYKTGEKHIFFRMHADAKKAWIAIEVTHKDGDIRQLYHEQFLQLKNILVSILGEHWEWQPECRDEHGKEVFRISKSMEGFSIFKREDWPALISFFKPRIIALDEFWSQARYSFESLR